MNDKLKELIQPYWVEEQQGVYIPLIDKVLLKNNVPEMPYGDYMEYAKSNGVQIATKDELLQMYLQKDEINKILREHNGDMLDSWFGSSSEYGLYYEWFVNFGSGFCYYATKLNYSASRVVVDLKLKKTNKKFDPGLGAMTSRPLEHVQLLATAYESANQNFGSSHYIKPQVSREYFERMSETQVRGLPFIGSLQPWKIAPKKEEVKDEDNW